MGSHYIVAFVVFALVYLIWRKSISEGLTPTDILVANMTPEREISQTLLHDFLGKWERQTWALSGRSVRSLELKYSQAGRLWASFDGAPLMPVWVRNVKPNKSIQIVVGDPHWNAYMTSRKKLSIRNHWKPTLSPAGQYDIEILTQLPTRTDPINMLRMKKHGDVIWTNYVLTSS